MSKRNLTPPETKAPGLPPTRRTGGSRREATERVHLFLESGEEDGWALNVSRGGVRAIADRAIDPGTRLDLAVGDGPRRPARVVWVQEEPDGAILGLEYLDVDSTGSSPNLEAVGGAVHSPPVKVDEPSK